MEAIRFNINEKVRVRLTETGLKQLEQEHNAIMGPMAERHPFKPPSVDADGYSEFQLWDLMLTLGKHCYMGPPLPFETEILLVQDDKSPPPP